LGLSQIQARRLRPLFDCLLFTTHITSRLFAHASYEHYERLTLFLYTFLPCSSHNVSFRAQQQFTGRPFYVRVPRNLPFVQHPVHTSHTERLEQRRRALRVWHYGLAWPPGSVAVRRRGHRRSDGSGTYSISQIPTLFAHTRLTLSFIHLRFPSCAFCFASFWETNYFPKKTPARLRLSD
jgi:hypothetical protein